MEVSALHPPNSQLLSDNVISNVVQQRSKRSLGVYVGLNSSVSTDVMSRPTQRPRLQQWTQQSPQYEEKATPPGNSPSRSWGKYQETVELISALRDKLQSPGTSASTESTARDGQLKAMVDLIIADKLRLRELRRVRQVRYRKKKDDYANSLDEANKKLRIEIEELAERRRSTLAAGPAKESGWSVAVEYFRQFQFGTSSSSETQQRAQIAFLKTTMAPDILFSSECGVKAMIGNWYYVSQWFSKFNIELDALATCASGTLVAKTITSITISENTIRKVFPHLVSSEDPAGMSSLAQELVGKTLVMHGTTRFEWDSERCRMGSIRSQSDLMTPLLRVLGSLDKVAQVFTGALITPEFLCTLTSSECSHK